MKLFAFILLVSVYGYGVLEPQDSERKDLSGEKLIKIQNKTTNDSDWTCLQFNTYTDCGDHEFGEGNCNPTAEAIEWYKENCQSNCTIFEHTYPDCASHLFGEAGCIPTIEKWKYYQDNCNFTCEYLNFVLSKCRLLHSQRVAEESAWYLENCNPPAEESAWYLWNCHHPTGSFLSNETKTVGI